MTPREPAWLPLLCRGQTQLPDSLYFRPLPRCADDAGQKKASRLSTKHTITHPDANIAPLHARRDQVKQISPANERTKPIIASHMHNV